MQLKNYQLNTLKVLQDFFEDCRIKGHKQAYKDIVSLPEIAYRLGILKSEYRVWDSIPNTPRICLKVPTGGGKTIIAAHALKIVSNTWLEKDCSIVVWFTPSDTICKQTLEALKNPRHPYREALDEQFNGKVKVFDIDEKFNIRPNDISDNLCIIVSTIQAFRHKDTSKYNVYKHNENLEPHFTHITPTETMEKENGKLKFSFANLLNFHRPIIIVDEAHNAITGLTQDMQERLNPCAIIELTATPLIDNNTLYTVKALELKEEEMIKLPIVLVEHNNWEQAVVEAINKRTELEKAAENEHEYVRPILLFQAQNINGEVNVEALKKYLLETMNLPESEIAIVTGEQKELDGINLFDKSCPIKYIITVEALKEGWDCSFAYVLCSLANVNSNTSVEQLLGRVMRMPYAKARTIASLNKAYAFVLSQKFGEATQGLVEKLKLKGFDSEEMCDIIKQEPSNFGLFGDLENNKIMIMSEIQDKYVAETIKLQKESGGKTQIIFTPQTTSEDIEKLGKGLTDEDSFKVKSKYQSYKAMLEKEIPFSKNDNSFIAPRMMFYHEDELLLADPEIIFEQFDWNIEEYISYKLEENEFRIEKQGNGFYIDIDNNTLKYGKSGDEQLEMSFVDVSGWTLENLVIWLDKTLKQPDIAQGQMLNWLGKVVKYLSETRQISISALTVAKYALTKKLASKIEEGRKKAKIRAYQVSLFEDKTSKVEMDLSNGFKFFDGMFDDQTFYQGSFKFSKHFLGNHKIPAIDGGERGEEFECAKTLDANAKIKYWVRNVARHTNAFKLPTSTDYFYPDFIAKLEDGRFLIVEYKGAHLSDNADTREKLLIGELFERKTNKQYLFMIAQKTKDGLNLKEQIDIKIK